MKFIHIFVLVLMPLVLYQCANIGQPDGGVRDLDPPILDTSGSTHLLQRNFHPDQDHSPISLKFNEWVKLEDVFKQVIVSPPLQYPPKIELKGKGVQLNFDPRETLLPSTTYTINFGKAIKDLTEGNVVKDLRFVFSTGDIIDTGSVNGKVFDARTSETAEDILVMLYYSNEDTIVYKRKPIYFSRTNKEGVFNIKNIKDTTYKIMVLEDANSNYLYDQDKESIGFLPRRINSGEDSSSLSIPYYKSYIKPKISSYSTDIPGLVKLNSNMPLQDLEPKALNDSIRIFSMTDKDTLLIYYLPIIAKNWDLEIKGKKITIDTIKVNKTKKITIDTFKAINIVKSLQVFAANNFDEIEYNHPLSKIDTTMITLYDDTSKVIVPVVIRSGSAINKLLIQCPCMEMHTYTLKIPPTAIHDYNDQRIKDTLVFKYKGLGQDEGGSLILDINNLDSTKAYSTSLMHEDKSLFEGSLNKVSKATVRYDHLTPGNYTLQLIEDINQNGRWDPGDYLLKIQPEKIMIQKNYNVRANWELREQLIWKP